MPLRLLRLCPWLLFGSALFLASGAGAIQAGAQSAGASRLHKVQESATTEQQKITTIDRASPQGFRAIEAAIPELERSGLRVDDYQIAVLQIGTSLVVLFSNPEQHTIPGHTGCMGLKPCFSVELRPEDLRVVRSGFSR